MTSQKARLDVHQEVTNTIVRMIEEGAGKFQMPWHLASAPIHMPRNIASKKHYRGINILMLWAIAKERGYQSEVWGTYKQWQEAGCQVRKGEKAALVTFYKEFDVDPDPKDPRDNGKRMFARASWAFNASQVDGADLQLPDDHGAIDRIASADSYVANTGATILHGGERAYYHPASDAIRMPSDGLFFGTPSQRTEAYYSTLCHELTHWTGIKKRCDREFGKRFGDDAYAFEELVAELGAAFMCSNLGITNEPRQDHARYMARWLEIMKGDKRAIFTASAKASQAVDYLDKLQSRAAPAVAA